MLFGVYTGIDLYIESNNKYRINFRDSTYVNQYIVYFSIKHYYFTIRWVGYLFVRARFCVVSVSKPDRLLVPSGRSPGDIWGAGLNRQNQNLQFILYDGSRIDRFWGIKPAMFFSLPLGRTAHRNYCYQLMGVD